MFLNSIFQSKCYWFIAEEFLEESLSRLGYLSALKKRWRKKKPYFLMTRASLNLDSGKSYSEMGTLELSSK